MLSPPLGSSRLKAVETVAALVRVSDDTAERTLMGAGLIPRCLELFLRFPFNNLLHHQARVLSKCPKPVNSLAYTPPAGCIS